MTNYTPPASDIIELKNEIKKLQEKLNIAVETLCSYANEDNWCEWTAGFYQKPVDLGCYGCYGFQEAQEALIKIKGV